MQDGGKTGTFPRVVIGAAASGSGKTTITCGILQALINRGMKVSSFKCGPDYIDPMFHSQVIGTSSANLDLFFAGKDIVKYLFAKGAEDTEISVIEGVMGYYDGLSIASSEASAYDLANTLSSPSILIIDAKGASTSVIATALGFLKFKENSRIKGIILNRVHESTYNKIKTEMEKMLDVEVLGYVPVMKDAALESRHLGLVTPDDVSDIKEKLEKIADILEKTIDLDRLIQLAEESPELSYSEASLPKGEKVKVAVAKDEAFCFMYKDNLDVLKEMGAEIVYFSPIHDASIPEADGVILYGGYPELRGEELSSNVSMMESIKKSISEGMPCLAECGGFMYLHEEMECADGSIKKMCNIIPGKTFRTEKLVRFGYVNLTCSEGSWILDKNECVKAHEFHYWNSTECGEDFTATRASGTGSWQCMHASNRLAAGYPHIFYRSCPQFALNFLKACSDYKREKMNICE